MSPVSLLLRTISWPGDKAGQARRWSRWVRVRAWISEAHGQALAELQRSSDKAERGSLKAKRWGSRFSSCLFLTKPSPRRSHIPGQTAALRAGPEPRHPSGRWEARGHAQDPGICLCRGSHVPPHSECYVSFLPHFTHTNPTSFSSAELHLPKN